MSKIISITETSFGTGDKYDGFVILLDDDSTVRMGIENGQCCCENWGYLMSEDSTSAFIGAKLLHTSVTDAELKHYDVESVYDGSAMFINIDTSAGRLQFVAYNEHNGYYSHDAVLIENGTVTHKAYL